MPSGQRALDHLEAVDLDLRLAIGMQRVKVGWIVIVEVHRDHEPEETTDRGHDGMVAAPPVGTRSRGWPACAFA